MDSQDLELADVGELVLREPERAVSAGEENWAKGGLRLGEEWRE